MCIFWQSLFAYEAGLLFPWPSANSLSTIPIGLVLQTLHYVCADVDNRSFIFTNTPIPPFICACVVVFFFINASTHATELFPIISDNSLPGFGLGSRWHVPDSSHLLREHTSRTYSGERVWCILCFLYCCCCSPGGMLQRLKCLAILPVRTLCSCCIGCVRVCWRHMFVYACVLVRVCISVLFL